MNSTGLDLTTLSKLAKIIVGKNKNEPSNDQNIGLYGTIEIDPDGTKYVRLDGSEQRTPVAEAMDAEHDDRVVCAIKNHQLVVTGNLTAPASARSASDILKPTGGNSIVGKLENGEPVGCYLIFKNDELLVVSSRENGAIPLATFKLSETRLNQNITSGTGALNLKVNDISSLTVNGTPLLDYIKIGTDTWKPNTKDQEGYVAAGSGHPNQVWKTDGSGNPEWGDIGGLDEFETYSMPCEYVYSTSVIKLCRNKMGCKMLYFNGLTDNIPIGQSFSLGRIPEKKYHPSIIPIYSTFGSPNRTPNVRLYIGTDGYLTIYRYNDASLNNASNTITYI